MSRITPEAPPQKKVQKRRLAIFLDSLTFSDLAPYNKCWDFFFHFLCLFVGLCKESIEIFLFYCGDLLPNCHPTEEQRIQQRIPLAIFLYGCQSLIGSACGSVFLFPSKRHSHVRSFGESKYHSLPYSFRLFAHTAMPRPRHVGSFLRFLSAKKCSARTGKNKNQIKKIRDMPTPPSSSR